LSEVTIRKDNAAFPTVRWLAQAVSKDASREILTVITVIGGKGYATDGHRMHIADLTGIEEGIYGIHKNTRQEITLETCGVTPPLYDSIIPKPGKLSKPLKVVLDDYGKGARAGNIVLAFARGSPAGVKVDLDFLLEALDIGDASPDSVEFRWTTAGAYRIIVVEYKTLYGKRKAVIMGLKA
jgi:hypothetical protein